MPAETIRHLRRRLGLTQSQLADALQVDQGTVSRWERSIETPRPSTFAALFRLLTRQDDERALQRAFAIVRQDMLPAMLVGPTNLLREVSLQAVAHHKEVHGLDIRSKLGTSFEDHIKELEIDRLWEAFACSGILKGEAIMVQFTLNARGRGYTTQLEPLLQDGASVGLLSTIVGQPSVEKTSDVLVERFDAIIPGEGNARVERLIG